MAAALVGPPEEFLYQEDGRQVPNPDFRMDLATEPVAEVARELFDFLESSAKNPGFDSVYDLEEWADNLCQFAAGSPTGYQIEEMTKDVAAALVGPLGTYQFEFELTSPRRAGHQYEPPSDWYLPGAYGLRLRPERTEGKFTALAVHGVVLAATWDGAARKVERVVDELCGALRCIGLCEFVAIQSDSVSAVAPKAFGPVAKIAGGQRDRRDGRLYHDLAGEVFGLDPGTALRLFGTRLMHPLDLSETERWLLKDKEWDRAIGRHLRALGKLFWCDTGRGRELRAACRRVVMAELSKDFGLTLTLGFSCLEGLLLDPKSTSDSTARLSEAVAHSLGATIEERSDLRSLVKRLYGLRSGFVHTGMTTQTARAVEEVLHLAHRVIRHEIDLLPDPPMNWVEVAQG
ncbi:MAG: hypothetical protein IPO09_20580 [Anaeromyxobacter sp.]|nr:hypothetical protein [Anaeromyxobacter sp.]